MVLIGIANHDGDGGAWPSLQTLATYANVNDVRYIRRVIRDLEAMGEIRTYLQDGGTRSTPDHARPNRYELLLRCPPACTGGPRHHVPTQDGDTPGRAVDNHPEPGGPQTRGGSTDPRGGGPQTPPGGVHRPPEPSLNRPGTIYEQSRKPPRDARAEVPPGDNAAQDLNTVDLLTILRDTHGLTTDGWTPADTDAARAIRRPGDTPTLLALALAGPTPVTTLRGALQRWQAARHQPTPPTPQRCPTHHTRTTNGTCTGCAADQLAAIGTRPHNPYDNPEE